MINEDKASIFWFYQIETLLDLSIELWEDVLFFVVRGCSLSKSNLFGRKRPWAGESAQGPSVEVLISYGRHSEQANIQQEVK